MAVPGVSVSASATQIQMGGSVTIRWQVSGATLVELLDYTSSQWKRVVLSGSKTYTILNKGSYYFHIRATGAGGTSQNNAAVEVLQAAPMVSPAVAAVTPAVTVNPPAATTPSASATSLLDTLGVSSIGGIDSTYLLIAAAVGLALLLFSGRKK